MISKIISTFIIILMMSIILAAPAAADQTGVSLNAPERMDGNFSVAIEITSVYDLDSGQFDLHFDPAVTRVVGVDDGNIGGTTIPIDNWAVVDENSIRTLFNLPGIDGVSGSGSLATIHFETIAPGDCVMAMSNGLLVDTMAELIPANWDGVEGVATETGTAIPTDTTELKTPGFEALFTIGALAAVIFAFKREE